MNQYLFILLVLLAPFVAYTTVFEIGNGKAYATPNALYNNGNNAIQNGDTILIYGGTYSGTSALAQWSDDNLLIRGVDTTPHLVANGAYILGKGIWVLSGDDIIVENIRFTGASVPDKNGAGIRLDGTGLTVRYCHFDQNENGILTSNPGTGNILIEFTEFSNNGYGDGYSHNLYIGRVASLTYRYNYSHHANIGHNLKSRARENYLMYNRIMDEATGNSSRLVDLSEGGFTIMVGNLFMQGPNAPNNNLVGYGLEGLAAGATHELYVVNNTFVNKRVASHKFLDIKAGTSATYIHNNIFAGGTNVVQGPVTAISHNYIDNNIGNLHFVDEPSYDYHLTAASPVIDHGKVVAPAGSHALIPQQAYEHLTGASLREIFGDSIDIGAYEYGLTTSNGHLITTSQNIDIFPNPFEDLIVINGALENFDVKIYNQIGQEIWDYSNANSPLYIDTQWLGVGTYFLSVQHTTNSSILVYTMIKP